MAALCANEQGKFWPMHDAMFSDQANLSVEDLKQKASRLDLDAEKFKGTGPGTPKRLYQRRKPLNLESFPAVLASFRKLCCIISHFGGEWCDGSVSDFRL